MVEEGEGGQSPAPENGEVCTEGVEETGEVEYVRPEEDPTRGSCTRREAEEPLEGSGFGATPVPPDVADFRGGGEEDAGEDCGGYKGHAEAVECGYWT